MQRPLTVLVSEFRFANANTTKGQLIKMSSRNKISLQEKRYKSREKEYTRKLKLLKQYGIYNPENSVLSGYRKTQINKRFAKYADQINSPDYVFLPVASQAKRFAADPKKLLKKADRLNMPVTRTGIFVAKEGSRRATLGYNKELGEYEITLSGRTKWGKDRGKRITTKIPLASLDELDAQKERIIAEGRIFGKLKKNEALAFEIRGNGHDGFSHETFGDIELLMAKLDEYKKSMPAKIKFFRHIVVVKTEMGLWHKLHPIQDKQTRRRKVNKKGRN